MVSLVPESRMPENRKIIQRGYVQKKNRCRVNDLNYFLPASGYLLSLGYSGSCVLNLKQETPDMGDQERPIGQRFSQVYLERGAPLADSKRMRVRVCALIRRMDVFNIGGYLEENIGIDIPHVREIYDWSVDYNSLISSCALRDFLDIITLVAAYMRRSGRTHHATNFIDGIETIFREESARYTIDEEGGVHPYVDSEFVHSRVSTVGVLSGPRYEAVLDCFEAAYSALDGDKMDGEEAIWRMFKSMEILFKLMFPAYNMAYREVSKHLPPLIQEVYGADRIAMTIADNQISSFYKWMEGAHYARHGQPKESVIQPPMGLVVLTLSNGAAFLRWLVELDQAKLALEKEQK